MLLGSFRTQGRLLRAAVLSLPVCLAFICSLSPRRQTTGTTISLSRLSPETNFSLLSTHQFSNLSLLAHKLFVSEKVLPLALEKGVLNRATPKTLCKLWRVSLLSSEHWITTSVSNYFLHGCLCHSHLCNEVSTGKSQRRGL